ncbi:MAG: DUF6660 family protein [Bacteroidota bacterium]
MKFLCLILSLLVVLLSVRPCCAEDNCMEDTIERAEQCSKSPNEGEHEKQCRDCSPFFSCGSCTGFIPAQPFTLTLQLQIEEVPFIIYTSYQQPDLKDVTLAIWQPPKLS